MSQMPEYQHATEHWTVIDIKPSKKDATVEPHCKHVKPFSSNVKAINCKCPKWMQHKEKMRKKDTFYHLINTDMVPKWYS